LALAGSAAMTNREIYKRYIQNLLNVMKTSKDPTDRAMHKYLGGKMKSLEQKLPEKIREMGEMPSIGWTHNVKPSAVRKMVHEANTNKHKPGWARAVVLKTITG